METRTCGSTGLKLPVLGIGCFSFGGGEYWGPQSQQDVDAVVAAAIDEGANYFDTAEVYNRGASETALGLALKGRRDQAIIGTKVSPDHTAPAVLRASCEASLRRLQTDRIDLYMVHWPINANSLRHYTTDAALLAKPPEVGAAFATLAALQREGKIKHIGVSNFGVKQLREVLATGVKLAINELPYSLLTRGIELEILPLCQQHGIGIMSYMTLMQGVLSRRLANFEELPPVRLRTRHFGGTRLGSRHGEAGIEPQTQAALEAIAGICEEARLPMSDVAFAWALANPAVTCVLAGCRNTAQLTENLRAIRRTLTPAQVAQLNAATEEVLRLLGGDVDYFQGAKDQRTE